MNQRDSVRDLLAGKSILLTGATGFLAKAFLEKLLRTVPDIGRVYLLIRASDARHTMARAENDIFSSGLFDHLKTASPRWFQRTLRDKVRFVNGETSRARLGLSAKDYLQLTHEVDVVVNAAASTDFLNRLDAAVGTNTISVAHLTEFVERSRRARLLHVSTCYVNEFMSGEVTEDFHAPAHLRDLDLDRMIRELEASVREGGDLVQTGLRTARAHGWNNVYTFTKWLGERFVERAGSRIHAAIVRPSIIESCAEAPHAGWIEGWKVADPLIYAVGTNRLGFFPARSETVIDVVPVDYVANAMFTALGELLRQTGPGVRVYQSCSGSENPLTVGRITRIIREAFAAHRDPQLLSPVLWRGVRTFAHAGQGLARLVFGDRAGGLGRFLQLADVYAPYTSMSVTFRNDRLLAANALLPEHDRRSYPVSCRRLDWENYLGTIHIPGLLTHVLRVPSVEAARRVA